MSRFFKPVCVLVLLIFVGSSMLPVGVFEDKAVPWPMSFLSLIGLGAMGGAALLGLVLQRPSTGGVLVFCGLSLLAAAAPLALLATDVVVEPASYGFWLYCAALLLVALAGLSALSALPSNKAWLNSVIPLLLGAWVVVFWQIGVHAFEVPRVLLPAPWVIATTLWDQWETLLDDFSMTVLHSALIGFIVGCAGGFLLGLLIDRSPFLQRGLLPVCALAGSVPLVGIAPIMVMWFGFEWHSKAAVVALMVFFPMLISTFAGLAATGRMELDLMRSYAAGHSRTLLALRLPTALPFLFNGLKVASTLALIGAIVAEFFGSPTVGMGFRISTEAARMNMGLVWATIVVAALAGTVTYALIQALEKKLTFWHPSQRP
jgi:NitT/TauT family transport system permease protein